MLTKPLDQTISLDPTDLDQFNKFVQALESTITKLREHREDDTTKLQSKRLLDQLERLKEPDLLTKFIWYIKNINKKQLMKFTFLLAQTLLHITSSSNLKLTWWLTIGLSILLLVLFELKEKTENPDQDRDRFGKIRRVFSGFIKNTQTCSNNGMVTLYP